MPSLNEPSGLTQFYRMRDGMPPVERATGGTDSVVDAYDATRADGTAAGFRFLPCTPDARLQAVPSNRSRPAAWRESVAVFRRQDGFRDRSAGEYVRLYERILGEERDV